MKRRRFELAVAERMFLKQSLVSFSRLVEKLISLADWLKGCKRCRMWEKNPVRWWWTRNLRWLTQSDLEDREVGAT